MGTSLIPLPPQITLYGLLDGPLEPLFLGTASVAREGPTPPTRSPRPPPRLGGSRRS